jgi:hypothetical protein
VSVWRRILAVVVLTIGVLIVAGLALGSYVLLVDEPRRDGEDVDSDPGTQWDRYAVRGKTLSIYYSGAVCEDSATAVTVDERSDRVVVTLQTVVNMGPCRDRQIRQRVTAQLDEPLRQRKVYDGACLEEQLPEKECLRARRAEPRTA